VAEVTMTLEEYLALVGEGQASPTRAPSRKPRKSGKPNPRMAAALRKANKMGRKKDGSLRKGWSQSKIMKKAHQLNRRGRK
jgi:hypothetical protein